MKEMNLFKENPIGVFDSGLGGISVLHTIQNLMPKEDLIYFGDSKYNPYGTKTKSEITKRCIEICDHLMERGCKAIVIACNTATSACVPLLRERYPVDIIGMEPALKVACSLGENQTVAVWATHFTLVEEKFAHLMERFDQEHRIVKVACPKLVQLVEEDRLDQKETIQKVLQGYIEQGPMDSLNSIVLGCTHFVFFKEQLQSILPASVSLVDGNLGTAMHLQELLKEKELLNEHGGSLILFENTLEEKIELSKRLFQKIGGMI